MAPIFLQTVDEFGRPRMSSPVNVLERADNGAPLPARPTQYANSFDRPAIEQVHQAASTIHYWDRKLMSKPTLRGKAWKYGVHVPWDTAHFVALEIPTQYIKALLLNIRSIGGIGPMSQKIQMEQAVRSVGYGLKPLSAYRRLASRHDILPGGSLVARTMADVVPVNQLGKPMYSIMGTVMDEVLPDTQFIRYFEPTKNLDVTLNSQRAELIAYGTYDHLTAMHADPLTRMVATRGAEGTLRYLETRPDTALGYWYEHGGGKANVELSTSTPLEWLRATELEIDQAAGGMPSLRRYVATGKWKPEGRAGYQEATQYALDRNNLVSETLDINRAIKAARAEGNLDLEQALAGRLAEIDARIETLDATQVEAGIASTNAGAFTTELLNRYTAGEYRFPPEVEIIRSAANDPVKGVRAAARRHSQKIYQGLRPTSWVDIRLTRGSMQWQYFERIYDSLVRNGWEKDRAKNIAHYEAGFRTSDHMYDITARTSAQRALRNLFWFAPV